MPQVKLPPGFKVIEPPKLPAGFKVIPQASVIDRDATSSFIGKGVAGVLGAPVDLVNSLLPDFLRTDKPVLGSESISSVLRSIGIPVATKPSESAAEKVAEGVGAAAGSLVPLVGVAGRMARGSGVAGQIGRTLLQPFKEAPVRAVATELASGAGAGAGEAVAENVKPGSDAAKAAGALLGSIATGLGPALWTRFSPTSAIARGAMRVGRQAKTLATGAHTESQAARRVRALAADPTVAAKRIAEPDIAGLTAAQKTGDDRLLALERTIVESDPQLSEKWKAQLTDATEKLRTAAKDLGVGGEIGKTKASIAARVNNLVSALENRAMASKQSAIAKIAKLEPARQASESSVIVRDELDSALKVARQAETELWGAIPQTAKASTANAKAAYVDIVKNTAKALRDDIPSDAKRLLGTPEESGEILMPGQVVEKPQTPSFGDTESIREI